MRKINIHLPSRIKGSAMVDSLLALSLLGLFLTGLMVSNLSNQNAKNAQLLATQTNTYAQVFARYMDINLTNLQTQISSGNSLTINAQTLGNSYWPLDLARTNLYGQTPCVTIIKNATTGNLEALMYYVGGKVDTSAKRTQLVNNTGVLLGNKGGILTNNQVKGNSGWSINQGSQFLSGAGSCGGSISSPSVAVNLDLMLTWNQNIQPNTSITKATDFGDTSNLKTLPGHMINTNTSKANVNFTANKGIIFDNSNSTNPTALQMGYGAGTNEATLSLSGSTVTTLVADTVQANQQGNVGDSCILQEVGKTITDKGQQSSGAYQYLARNTLVCTQNNMLCASVNADSTCYLPSIINSIVFQNNNTGIQDTNGSFACPTEVPFASSIVTSSGGSASSEPIEASLAGYSVTTGYRLTTAGVVINQVTCSNMPLYQEN